jgi:hypothetical protein
VGWAGSSIQHPASCISLIEDDFSTNERFDSCFFGRFPETWRPGDGVAIDQRHRLEPELHRPLDQILRLRRSFEKRECRRAVELRVLHEEFLVG